MRRNANGQRNEYKCIIERTQNGKYCVRLRAVFRRRDWSLPLYFLASSFDRAIQKLAEVLQFLQQKEERLWFWAVDRSDDPKMVEELLAETGLKLDRRNDFPERAAGILVPVEKPVPPFLLSTLRRSLASSFASERTRSLASD